MAILSDIGAGSLLSGFSARPVRDDGQAGWRVCGRLGMVLALLFLTWSCIAGSSGVSVPAASNVERSVKAAFLYKFLGYVDFPGAQDSAAPLVVGVLGADDIATELGRITAGRSVGNRAVTVRTLREGDPVSGLHMLLIGDVARPVPVLRAAQQNSVLSVTETDDGLQQGSVINFRLVEERVRFEVSLPAAEKSGLKLSSRLLSVAYHVQKGTQ
ncbi:MAG: YfiR family protein [Pseudomonadota bacterium]